MEKHIYYTNQKIYIYKILYYNNQKSAQVAILLSDTISIKKKVVTRDKEHFIIKRLIHQKLYSIINIYTPNNKDNIYEAKLTARNTKQTKIDLYISLSIMRSTRQKTNKEDLNTVNLT